VLVKCLDYGSARTLLYSRRFEHVPAKDVPCYSDNEAQQERNAPAQASSAAVAMLARRDERRRAREPVTNPEVADVRSSPGSIQAVAARPPCLEARRYFAMGAERGPPLLEASLALAASRVSFWRDMLELKLVSGEERHNLEKACSVVQHAARSALSDGVFVGFAARGDDLTPQDVMTSANASKKA
jgi:hypothetical protein